MPNIHLGKDREKQVDKFIKKNGISRSFLLQRLVDAFLANPQIFLSQFTINSENNLEAKKETQPDQQAA